jgi:hypothetical protein
MVSLSRRSGQRQTFPQPMAEASHRAAIPPGERID